MQPLWIWIAFSILILGTLGTILPFIPGLPIMALVILVYGWIEGFQAINVWFVLFTLIATIIGTLADYLGGPYAAKKLGASAYGVWGAIIGGILGLFIIGPLGLLVGPFLGCVVGELMVGAKLPQATKIGAGSLIGIVVANLLKFVFALAISIIFLVRVIL